MVARDSGSCDPHTSGGKYAGVGRGGQKVVLWLFGPEQSSCFSIKVISS